MPALPFQLPILADTSAADGGSRGNSPSSGTEAPHPARSRGDFFSIERPGTPLALAATQPLPMNRTEMQARGWDEVDVVFVTGDAYVDHPSFAMALVGRLLESEGLRVAILSQPDWQTCNAWREFGQPRLFFAISAGNMDSMINHYTANRKVRNDDAYSPGGAIGRRPDRATLAYCQRAREAYKGVPIIAGGVEASLRRLAHYDYWSDKVRRPILLDCKADLLVFGMGERPILEIAARLRAGKSVAECHDIRGVAYRLGAKAAAAFAEDLSPVTASFTRRESPAPANSTPPVTASFTRRESPVPANSTPPAPPVTASFSRPVPPVAASSTRRESPVPASSTRYESTSSLHPPRPTSSDNLWPGTIRLPDVRTVQSDPLEFCRMTRISHQETNPYNAKRLVQYDGAEAVVVNPPAYPLLQSEMDRVYGLPFTRRPHPAYGGQKIPAWDVIRTSVQIMRGCFGGCTFCSITAHEGRIIQSRSADSVIAEIRKMAAEPDFTGVISDIGGPTANMYEMQCTRPEVEAKCRRLSCVHPTICKLLGTDHGPLVQLMRDARSEPGVRKVLVASGIRMDLARRDPVYMRELAQHHVGGYLKVAPEHTSPAVLDLMKKPSAEDFVEFGKEFKSASAAVGKKQYLVPYFIASHPGSDLAAMIDLALFLKRNHYQPDQVQDFIPSPFDIAACMYHTGLDPFTLKPVAIAKHLRDRKLQRALLQFFKPENYFEVRQALEQAGRQDLIGDGCDCLIPARAPKEALNQRRKKANQDLREQTSGDHIRGGPGEKTGGGLASRTTPSAAAGGYRPHRKTQRRPNRGGK